jgi:hypothetical protein
MRTRAHPRPSPPAEAPYDVGGFFGALFVCGLIGAAAWAAIIVAAINLL